MAIGNTETVHGIRLDPKATPPASPVEGELYHDSNTHALCYRDNSAWVPLTAGAVSTAKAPVKVATEWPLPANTVVGNVMTANANGALPAIDGRTMAVNERLLVTKEGGAGVAHVNNGWYVVTDLGSPSTPWVLTRPVDGQQGQVIPGSLLYVENGVSGEDPSGLDVIMNRVSTTTSPTDPQWSILRAGDIMVDLADCDISAVRQWPVTTDGVLPVTPTVGYRYAALGPASYARPPQVRVKARVVSTSTSQSGGIWSILEVGDLVFTVGGSLKARICDSVGHLNAAPTVGTTYIILGSPTDMSHSKLVGPSQGSFFAAINSYRHDPVWQDYRAAGDSILYWKTNANDMWLYMDDFPGVSATDMTLDANVRALFFQRQRATAGRRLWVLATPEPITIGVTPLLFKPVAYS